MTVEQFHPFINKPKTSPMSNLRNRVFLIGNVGKDPEIKNLEKSKLAVFSLATNEQYRDSKGEKQTDTQWHRLAAWGKLAEIVENYVKKGKEIAIEGSLLTRSYETEKGEKRYSTEIKVSELLLLGSRPE